MDDRCCSSAHLPTRATCPGCGAQGLQVAHATVKALLQSPALRRLEPGSFHFCAMTACDVVYFSGAGVSFHTRDVRVPVWQKVPPGARIVCYCFDENESDIRRELASTGQTEAIRRVRKHIAERRCACEVRNPRGVCCLGDLTATVTSLCQSGESKV